MEGEGYGGRGREGYGGRGRERAMEGEGVIVHSDAGSDCVLHSSSVVFVYPGLLY